MAVDYLVDWPEAVAVVFFCIGLVIALLSRTFWVLYSVAFLLGLVFGRIWYRQRSSSKVPLIIVLALLFLGIIVGSFFAWVRPVTVLMLNGVLLAYWLHKKGFIESVEF